MVNIFHQIILVLLNGGKQNLICFSISFISNSGKVVYDSVEFFNKLIWQRESFVGHGHLQEAIHLVLSQETFVEELALVHAKEHRLDINHLMGVLVAQRSMVSSGLSPCIDLTHEILAKGPLSAESIWFGRWGILWDHVKFLHIDVSLEELLKIFN